MSIEEIQSGFENKNELIEQRKQLAMEFGKFYPITINILINSEIDFDEKKERIKDLLKEFSPKAQKVFMEMYEKVLIYLKGKKEKLNEIGGKDEKISYFLKYPVIGSLKEKIKYFEIGDSIPVFDIDDKLYQKLFGVNSAGFMKQNKDGLNFIAIRNFQDSSDLNLREGEKVLMHEIHHYIFRIFSQCNRKEGYADRENKDKIWETAFDSFKDELMAYIVDGLNIGVVNVSKNLIYFDDSYEKNKTGVVETAEKVRGSVFLALEYLKNKFGKNGDFNRRTFLYPIMRAKNFDDLEKRVLEILPIGNLLDRTDLWDLYDFWDRFKNLDEIDKRLSKFFQKVFSYQNIKLKDGDFEIIKKDIEEHPLIDEIKVEKFISFLKSLVK